MERRPLFIDTDGGVDDAVAIMWAATSSLVELAGISVVHGNVPMEQAARNVLATLDAAGRHDVPVVLGASEPLGPVPALRRADFIHGVDGLGGHAVEPSRQVEIGVSVAELFTRVLDRHGGDVTLVSLGPMTNVAVLATHHADLVRRCEGWVAMGGSVGLPGNALPMAEANVAHDPTAAQAGLAAPWRRPPLMVGLDVTHQATLTPREFEILDHGRSAAARFLQGPLHFYRRFAGTFCQSGETPCHDLLAVAGAVVALVDGPVLPTAVQVQPGPAWGALVADRRVPYFQRAGSDSVQAPAEGMFPCRVALDADVQGFRSLVRQLFN